MKKQEISRQEVAGLITNINSAEDIYGLFKSLNYPEDVLFDFPSKRKKSAFDLSKEEGQKVKEIYSILNAVCDFFYITIPFICSGSRFNCKFIKTQIV